MPHRFILMMPLLAVLGLIVTSCTKPPETVSPPPQDRRVEQEAASKELRKLADAGDAKAQNQLGVFYSEGLQDYVQAKRWFEKAAEQGHAGAQVNLGTLYLHGRGAPQSDQMALSWFRRAAQQQDALAFAKLGLMHALGRGVPKDYVKAYMWYDLSTKHGEKRSAEFRDSLAKKMTPAQVAEAQRLAAAWTPKTK